MSLINCFGKKFYLNLKQIAKIQQVACSSHYSVVQANLDKIGKREIVCHGKNGEPIYYDEIENPFPSIRFKEPNPDSLALNEKEKGDWRKLSLEEKKALYRHSFRQTFSEVYAPDGQWKSVIGVTLVFCAITVWIQIWTMMYWYDPIPETFHRDRMDAQIKRRIGLRAEPFSGVASRWDYETNDWKK